MTKSFNFNSFKLANPEIDVSGIDYVRAIYKTHQIDADFLVWFARLFWPVFKVVDGRIYVDNLFDENRYQKLLSNGITPKCAQYWMNLLEITGLFDDIKDSQALELAEIIVNAWNSKMLACNVVGASARVINDSNTKEIFVTIGSCE
jgi:hypothetical protein